MSGAFNPTREWYDALMRRRRGMNLKTMVDEEDIAEVRRICAGIIDGYERWRARALAAETEVKRLRAVAEEENAG